MKHWTGTGIRLLSVAVAVGGLSAGYSLARAADDTPVPLTVGLSAGMINFEGDESVRDAFLGSLQIGYDLSDAFTLEGVLDIAPVLHQNFRTDWDTGQNISRLRTDAGVDQTDSVGLALDVLYHFAGRKRVDPYLTLGAGWVHYADEFDDQPGRLRAGGGVFLHLNESWALRVDARVQEGLWDQAEFNLITTAGLCWSPAGRKTAGATIIMAPSETIDRPSTVAKNLTPALPPPDDLQMFKLDLIVAEEGKWHPEYLSELDAIAKAIQAHPTSDVWIEGHMDQQAGLSDRDARSLTGKQAETVRDYFVKNHAIAPKRLQAIGYGFSRPKGANDPANGNPANRRIEIHIRPPQAAR
jgi:hypothetical protein